MAGLGRLTVDGNAPNPFGSSTAIRFQVPQDPEHLDRGQWIALRIYNARGQWIRTLAEGIYPAGYYVMVWDGREESGLLLPGGSAPLALQPVIVYAELRRTGS